MRTELSQTKDWDRNKERKQGDFHRGDCVGVYMLEAASIKTSIKTLPCPYTASEYIRVH